MPASTDCAARPIARQQWLELISRHAAVPAHHNWKRRSRRYSVRQGEAKLVFTVAAGLRKVPVVRTAPLLEVSADGMAVKSHKEIPVNTGMGIEVNLDGNPVTLLGTVAHCTLTLGGYRIGIRLMFSDTLPSWSRHGPPPG